MFPCLDVPFNFSALVSSVLVYKAYRACSQFFFHCNLLYVFVYTGQSSTTKTEGIGQGQPSGYSPAAEITSIATGMTTI